MFLDRLVDLKNTNNQKSQQDTTGSLTDGNCHKDETNLKHNLSKKEEKNKDFVKLSYKFISKILTNGSFKKSLNKKDIKLSNSNSATSSSYSNLSISNSFHLNNQKIDQDPLPASPDPPIDQTDQVASIKMSNLNHKPTAYSTKAQPNHQETFYLLNKKIRPHMPFNLGLKNHGNTCFMNCILQCIFHTSPLAEFFIAGQCERDIQNKTYQISYEKQNGSSLKQNQFILTRYFSRLLYSMWRNGYESNYSYDLKQIIGCINPMFAGGYQNDSHEFCVWLLDKLSQELTIKIPLSLKDPNKVHSSSFLEELFQIRFKSTVVCTRCSYQSSKNETDMMLSLPLPTNGKANKNLKNKNSTLYPHLILSNQMTIKRLIINNADSVQTSNSDSSSDTSSKSKFYLNETDHPDNSNGEVTSYRTPFHVKLGLSLIENDNVHHQSFNLYSIEYNSVASDPCFGDLKTYLSDIYSLPRSLIVFIDLNRIQLNLNDNQFISDIVAVRKMNEDNGNESLLDSLCVVELVYPIVKAVPFINIIGINVYFESLEPGGLSPRCVPYGLPFVLLINRDCSYSELCRKIIEAQSKYFKDKNTIKYKVGL